MPQAPVHSAPTRHFPFLMKSRMNQTSSTGAAGRGLPAWFFLPCLLLFTLLALPSCLHAPPIGYADSPDIVKKRDELSSKLVRLLPPEQQPVAEAQTEARWLADTAYKAGAAIARQYEPSMPGWLNNRLVNSNFNLQERGLCWHYENDMYRELRRRHLDYFRIGCCVRDKGKGAEHNCVYVAPRLSGWPQVVILDPWRYSGRLRIYEREEAIRDEWADDVPGTRALANIYTEAHPFPMEHWARVKSGRKWNDYVPSWSPEGTSSRQGMLMQYRMYKALKERGGKLTNY